MHRGFILAVNALGKKTAIKLYSKSQFSKIYIPANACINHHMEIKWEISVSFSKTDIKREGEDNTVRERDEKEEELSVLYTEAKR